jgi:repressor LexA
VKEPLTSRQQEVLDWITEYIRVNGFPPTRKEIGTAFSFTNNAAQSHLGALANKRHIELIEGISRGMRIVP